MDSGRASGAARRVAVTLSLFLGSSAWVLGGPGPARAAVAHVVAPGETLWSIAAANNFTTRTVAAYNGISEDALVAAGQTIEVPTVEEGAAALASAGITPGSPTSADASTTTASTGAPPAADPGSTVPTSGS